MELYINNNKINCISINNSKFEPYTNVKVIQLDNNTVQDIVEKILEGINSIQIIDNNIIEDFDFISNSFSNYNIFFVYKRSAAIYGNIWSNRFNNQQYLQFKV